MRVLQEESCRSLTFSSFAYFWWTALGLTKAPFGRSFIGASVLLENVLFSFGKDAASQLSLIWLHPRSTEEKDVLHQKLFD